MRRPSPCRNAPHHHRVIQKAANSWAATGDNHPIAEQRVLEEPTVWWFAALLLLLGFSVLDIIAKSTGGGATLPPSPAKAMGRDRL
jgi:hypothetical protein